MGFWTSRRGGLAGFAQDGVKRTTYRAVATTPPAPYSTLQVPPARILDCRREYRKPPVSYARVSSRTFVRSEEGLVCDAQDCDIVVLTRRDNIQVDCRRYPLGGVAGAVQWIDEVGSYEHLDSSLRRVSTTPARAHICCSVVCRIR
jgi:hypothetical protein